MSVESIKLKEQQVAEYAEKFGKAKSVVLVDYRGLTVTEDTAMRNEMRKAGVEYKEGPTAVAVSYDDAVAPSKIVVDTVKKTNDKIAVKGGVVEGKVMDANGIKTVATIPAKPVLVAQLLGMLQSPLRGLAVALSEIAKKKEA